LDGRVLPAGLKLRCGPETPCRVASRSSARVATAAGLSKIQKRAIPFLKPLIHGNKTVLGEDAQKAIFAWCAMATMTGDYLSRDTTAVAISQAERDWFRDHGSPPENWKIWIGHYPGRRGIWTHYVVSILNAQQSREIDDDGLAAPNTQATTFVIGNLCVHVLSGEPGLVAGWNWPFGSRIALNLPRLFPPKEEVIVWPPKSLTDFEVELISTALERVIAGASQSMIGRRIV
jgi:hypothetical protein